MTDKDDIKTKNAVTCRICGSSADLMVQGFYQCQKNEHHVGDTNVGIFTDLTPPDSLRR